MRTGVPKEIHEGGRRVAKIPKLAEPLIKLLHRLDIRSVMSGYEFISEKQ